MPIRADSPCHERWADFEARPGGRHCGSCDVTVVDLTRLTRRRAEALVAASGGRMCARMRVDRDGAPVFRPETERAPSFLGAAVGLLAAACSSASAAEPAPEPPRATLLVETHATSGSLMRTEHVPMRPLAGTEHDEVAPTEVSIATPEPDPTPTPEQLLLTAEKEERETRGRTRRRTRTTTASVAPGTVVHPLPPMNVSRPTPLDLGGISDSP
jgi:hypothetical protein